MNVMRNVFLVLILLATALPLAPMEKEEQAEQKQETVTLEQVANGSEKITIETLIPLQSRDNTLVAAPLTWVRYSETLEHLLGDVGITIKVDGEQKTIVPTPVPNVPSDILNFIFNSMVPLLADNKFDLDELLAQKEIPFVIDLMLAANYLDIKIHRENDLLYKLIRYCAQQIKHDSKKNNIQALLKKIPPVLRCKILKELSYPFACAKPLITFNGDMQSGRAICTAKIQETVVIVSVSNDGMVDIWDMHGKLQKTFTGHACTITALFTLETEEGLHIISGHIDGRICVWDMQGNLQATCEENPDHANTVLSMFPIKTEEGWRIVSVHNDSTMCVWDMQGTQLWFWQYSQNINAISAAQVDCSDVVICLLDDGAVTAWDMDGYEIGNSGTCINRFISVSSIKTAEGWCVLAAHSDGRVYLSNLESNNCTIFELPISGAHSILSVCAIETKDGCRVIATFQDGTLCVWDMQGNIVVRCKDPIIACASFVSAVDTQEGLRIIVGCDDGKLSIWDTLAVIEKYNQLTCEQAAKLYDLLTSNNHHEKLLYQKIKGFFKQVEQEHREKELRVAASLKKEKEEAKNCRARFNGLKNNKKTGFFEIIHKNQKRHNK